MIDFRFDPFLFVFKPKNITGEVRTVQYFPAFNRVGFFLGETPQRLTTAPVSVICAGDTLGEVSRLAAPGVDNFRVDYGNVNNFAQAGFVEIHTSRAGQVAVINYRGLGVNLNASLRTDARKNLQRSIRVAKNATSLSLTVPDSFTVNGGVSAGAQRIRDLSVLSSTDLINLSEFLKLTGRVTPAILTGSGNWVKPANVSKVFFVLVGPGGSGHIDGGGGGGGASVYGVADLAAIGGNMFAYVVGVVGIATTMFGCVAGAGSSASGANGASGGAGSVGTDVVGKSVPGGTGASGFYVAVSSTGASRIMTSSNGVDWFSKPAPEANTWQAVTYGAGVWVAVSADGSNRVMRSVDGTTWASQTAAEQNQWSWVTYGNGLFVALAQTGTNRVMTSPDGITWTSRSAAEANQWLSVRFGAAGAGGSSGGGFGGNGNDADCGKPGARKGFFSGSGGGVTTAPENYGGGAGAGGTGADGLILLVY